MTFWGQGLQNVKHLISLREMSSEVSTRRTRRSGPPPKTKKETAVEDTSSVVEEESPQKSPRKRAKVKTIDDPDADYRNHHFYEAIANNDPELATKIREEYPQQLSFEIKKPKKGRKGTQRFIVNYQGRLSVKITSGNAGIPATLENFKNQDQMIVYLQKEILGALSANRRCRPILRSLVYECPVDQDTEFPLHDAEEVQITLGEYGLNDVEPFIDLLTRTYFNGLSQVVYWHWEHEDTFQMELSKDLYLHLEKNPKTKQWDLFIVSYALQNSFFIIGLADKKMWSKFDFLKHGLYQWHRLDNEGLWEKKGVQNPVDNDEVFSIVKTLK